MMTIWVLALVGMLQLPLTTTDGLVPVGATLSTVTFNGRRAVRMAPDSAAQASARDSLTFGALALVSGSAFHNGTIEVHVAATRAPDADTAVRGFAGLAFRTTNDGGRFECFFLRATNGRARDQIRRNHTLQYQSRPEAPWYVLRRDSPGRYESYTDIGPGDWVTIRIVVRGNEAALYVNAAREPSLIVSDLKLGDSSGLVGLWVGPGTVAYFSWLVVTPSA